MATAKTAKGFALSCPFCGASDDNTLNLDLNEIALVRCGGCDEEFTIEAARDKAAETLTAWDKVCRWIAMGQELANE